MMKRFAVIILAFVLGISLLSGCADPLAKEFERFINDDMEEVNANYEAIKKEASTWSELDDAAWLTSLKDVLIPKCEETLEILLSIELKTDEVDSIRDDFSAVITSYKKGFELLLEGMETASNEKLEEGNEKLQDAKDKVSEYNKDLKALSEKLRIEIK